MTTPSLELTVQRKLTKAFIDTKPIELVLRPRVRAETPSGGFRWEDGQPRPAQTLRIVEPSTHVNLAPEPRRTNDGEQRKIEFLLLGEWDAVIGQDDTFTYQGREWQVVELAYDNGWEQRASVARYG